MSIIDLYLGKFIHFFKYKMHLYEEKYLSMKIKNKLKYCGNGCVFSKSFILYPENIEIGNNVMLGEGARIVGDGGLYIGDNTHIARNLTINTSNHNYLGDRLPYDDTYIKKPVYIGKNVWIGINVIISPGSTIEDGCIIGNGCVIHGKIEKNSIVANDSTKVIKTRDEEHYNRLEELGIYGGENGEAI